MTHSLSLLNFLVIFSPTSDGGAAAVVCSEKFVRERGLEDRAVEILAMEMATDLPSTFQEKSCIKVVCFSLYTSDLCKACTYYR